VIVKIGSRRISLLSGKYWINDILAGSIVRFTCGIGINICVGQLEDYIRIVTRNGAEHLHESFWYLIEVFSGHRLETKAPGLMTLLVLLIALSLSGRSRKPTRRGHCPGGFFVSGIS
jgi:hypothetical protein